jgi:hypothetical protein
LRYLFLNGVGGDPNDDYAATIPQQTFMIFQLMFAIITPALSAAPLPSACASARCCCSPFYGYSWCTSRWRTWCGEAAGC